MHDCIDEAEMIKLKGVTLLFLVFLSTKERSVGYNDICTLFRNTGFIINKWIPQEDWEILSQK